MELSIIVLIIGLAIFTPLIVIVLINKINSTKTNVLKMDILIYSSIVLFSLHSTQYVKYPFDLLPLGIGIIALLLLIRCVASPNR